MKTNGYGLSTEPEMNRLLTNALAEISELTMDMLGGVLTDEELEQLIERKQFEFLREIGEKHPDVAWPIYDRKDLH